MKRRAEAMKHRDHIRSATLVLAMAAVAVCPVVGCKTTETQSYAEAPVMKAPVFDTAVSIEPSVPVADTAAPVQPAAGTGAGTAVSTPAAGTGPAVITAERELPKTIVTDLNLGADTDVATVLRALARAGNLNLVTSRNVKGPVSFTFTKVPWDQAFKGVLASAGLTHAWEGEIVRVMTVEDMKQDLEIEKIRHERSTVQADLRRVEPLVIRTIKVRYSNAKKLAETLGSLWKPENAGAPDSPSPVRRGSVTVDEDNNTIVVNAIREEADKVAALVEQLDVPKRQILIKAKIVEANRNTARDLGIQWGGFYKSLDGDYTHEMNSGAGRQFAANFPATMSDDIGFTFGFISQRLPGGELLNIQLSALQDDGKVNILSSPSITTLDNETAVIESGQERAYRETSGTGNDLDVSIAWKKAVLKLEVTPHLIGDRLMRVEIVASKDSFDETKQESNGEFPVNTKNARTTVVVRDGDTTVIGGLSQETRSESESGIPFLKDIPIVGRLFGGQRKGSINDEVLIFITPQILPGPV
jgi:type IV pilus assembly protein PilQ